MRSGGLMRLDQMFLRNLGVMRGLRHVESHRAPSAKNQNQCQRTYAEKIHSASILSKYGAMAHILFIGQAGLCDQFGACFPLQYPKPRHDVEILKYDPDSQSTVAYTLVSFFAGLATLVKSAHTYPVRHS